MLEHKTQIEGLEMVEDKKFGEDEVERELERIEGYWMNINFGINWNWEYYKSIYTLRE